MKAAVRAILLVICLSRPAEAAVIDIARQNFGERANLNFILTSPFPLLYLDEGNYKVSFKPAYLDISFDQITQNERFFLAGETEGYGVSVGASYAFKDRWGVWGFGFGGYYDGDLSRTVNECPVGSVECFDNDLTDISQTNLNLGFGLTYQIVRGEKNGFSLPVFFGPLVSYNNYSQSIRTSDAGTVVSDFDMRSDGMTLGLMWGVHAAVPLSIIPYVNRVEFLTRWTLQPYWVGYRYIVNRCHDYDVKNVRAEDSSGLGLQTASTSGCEGERQFSVQESEVGLRSISEYAGYGIAATYNPWNLTLQALFTVDPFGIEKRFFRQEEPAKFRYFSLSWNFGNETESPVEPR